MSDVINLRRERKRRKSVEDAKDAETNRRLFGRTKGQKMADSLEKQRLKTLLDGKNIFSLKDDGS
ncbi:hypothetical protein Gbth_013_045 [Gluconobacter thailandicus F149-1 = NBRC 100600]|uniref:DUF4169 domain-containing protein n=1 Tax=Gluconobacter thailandicus NBRC 3257 TaxID=1381097 RepID=A0ABQ0IYN5_GLUTH|nr:DUF4169 family protein [Gluconobacter thailandicus]AFV99691.1 hypothetical protein B932_0081 [Gluconobacter oxydans H24]ANQ41459.1 hypothetical protein BAR24_08290 [Gluconobacter oxydans]KXV52528.1 hypothetical protein AD946_12475 [Gluconobacter thailandicus]GAC87187.1 hypothetical protein NBRC3255_0848 [Gluconobacter thailandicus NBRC 3255]GAD27293.1 hypothetical protein NBRC3257_2291 [Gluconobacter thailandicus NBRC 3257]